jgi:hypothetical protein
VIVEGRDATPAPWQTYNPEQFLFHDGRITCGRFREAKFQPGAWARLDGPKGWYRLTSTIRKGGRAYTGDELRVGLQDGPDGRNTSWAQSVGRGRFEGLVLHEQAEAHLVVGPWGKPAGEWEVSDVRATQVAPLFDERGTWNARTPGGDIAPRFVVGMYDSGWGYPVPEERLDELQALGINAYLNFHHGEAPADALRPQLDALYARDMRWVHTANLPYVKVNRTRLEDTARDLAAHPAMLAFYVMDERPARMAPEIRERVDRLRRVAPHVPCYGVTDKPADLVWWRFLDVLGTDVYPIKSVSDPLSKASDAVAEVRRLFPGRPNWAVVQWFPFMGGRYPTREDVRTLALEAVQAGATGLFFWTYSEAFVHGPDRERMKADLKDVLAEVRDRVGH